MVVWVGMVLIGSCIWVWHYLWGIRMCVLVGVGVGLWLSKDQAKCAVSLFQLPVDSDIELSTTFPVLCLPASCCHAGRQIYNELNLRNCNLMVSFIRVVMVMASLHSNRKLPKILCYTEVITQFLNPRWYKDWNPKHFQQASANGSGLQFQLLWGCGS